MLFQEIGLEAQRRHKGKSLARALGSVAGKMREEGAARGPYQSGFHRDLLFLPASTCKYMYCHLLTLAGSCLLLNPPLAWAPLILPGSVYLSLSWLCAALNAGLRSNIHELHCRGTACLGSVRLRFSLTCVYQAMMRGSPQPPLSPTHSGTPAISLFLLACASALAVLASGQLRKQHPA